MRSKEGEEYFKGIMNQLKKVSEVKEKEDCD